MTRIADLPFHERPAIELLDLATDRDAPNLEYAGFGWARVEEVWLANVDGTSQRVANALIVAMHSADDGEVLADDIELEFDLPGQPVTVLASVFLAQWLPRLPQDAGVIVLSICNPHRAVLGRPAATTVPVHYALGNVTSWLELGENRPDRIRLAAETWCTLQAPMSTDLELTRRPGTVITDEQKHTFAGLYLLKKLDVDPKEGGMEIPVVMPPELEPVNDTMQQLAVDGLVEINAKKARWQLTKQGVRYLGEVIDEASDLVDEFDDEEMDEVIAILRERKLDVYRARFLWGWFEGEFDDLVLFQERRGASPIER
ncbi:MAG: hypothetical protein H0T79_09890, partial [Deltaproteobacteria bacterium]|nr:hypothetical protein [Deltaproteobacteria bacterium]